MNSYLINRNDRQDRLLDVRTEFIKQGINPHRFEAIEGGWKGCRDSHLAILMKCKKDSIFAVYEDDVQFLLDKEATTRILSYAMVELPENWDALYLGASPQKLQTQYSDTLYLLDGAKTTHSIIWHNREDGAVEYIINHRGDIKKWDVYLLGVIQPKFNCFVTYPMLVTQRQTQSDTCKRSDVSTIITNYNKYCP